MLGRLSIRRKLIGLVFVLLSIMLGVAGYSFFKTNLIRQDVNGLSEELIPLVNSLTLVNAVARDQGVAFERTLRYLHDPQADQALCQETAKEFAELGNQVRDHIRKAKRQARDDAQAARNVQDAIELANVRSALRVLQREHKVYTRLANELIKAELAARGQERTPQQEQMFEFRETRLVEEVESLETQLNEQLSHLVGFTQRRAALIRENEEGFFWSSLQNLSLAAFAFCIGLLIAVIMTQRIVGPINDLVRAAQRVRQGDLEVEVGVQSQDEVGQLADAFNTMVHGLRSREKVKEAFGKYLDPRIVENVIDGQDLSEADADRRVMTVFFSDIAGFSSISEQLTPSGLVKLINRYFTLATDPIARHHGVVDKYIGDAIMAFWGPPFTEEDQQAHMACRAALEQFEALAEFRRQLPELLGFRKGLPRVDIRIGLCTGDLVVGNIGSDRAKSFTVMGDTVNVASRLESANKQFGTRVLMSETTWRLVHEEFETREIDNIMVVGKKEPTRVFELLARKGDLEPAADHLRNEFERGLAAYRQRDWSTAERHLEECRSIDPGDGPTQVFRDRIAQLRGNPPPDRWDGVWRLDTK